MSACPYEIELNLAQLHQNPSSIIFDLTTSTNASIERVAKENFENKEVSEKHLTWCQTNNSKGYARAYNPHCRLFFPFKRDGNERTDSLRVIKLLGCPNMHHQQLYESIFFGPLTISPILSSFAKHKHQIQDRNQLCA